MNAGERLYASLPAVHRALDADGQLKAYLDAFGLSLDRIYATLLQGLADARPGSEDMQSWVLPYWADLLDARLLSPTAAGRRAELASAVRWQMRRGTAAVASEVVEAIGGYAGRARVAEGFRRVLVTPDVSIGSTAKATLERQLAFPHGTADVRRLSRRVQTTAGTTTIVNPGALPLFPFSNEDATRRTLDLRQPGPRRGHSHPTRVIVFAPANDGFFAPGWDKPTGGRNVLQGPLTLSAAAVLSDSVVVGDVTLDAGDSAKHVLRNCIVTGVLTLAAGQLELERCAVNALRALPDSQSQPSTVARASLLGSLDAKGWLRFFACTVLETSAAWAIQATDSIFAGSLSVVEPPTHPGPAATPRTCFRYSRISKEVREALRPTCQAFECTVDSAVFVDAAFATAGAGALAASCPRTLRSGAEDGGELGAFWAERSEAKARAVALKVQRDLPVGFTCTLVSDRRVGTALPRPPTPG